MQYLMVLIYTVIPMVHTYLVRSDLLPSSLCDIGEY